MHRYNIAHAPTTDGNLYTDIYHTGSLLIGHCTKPGDGKETVQPAALSKPGLRTWPQGLESAVPSVFSRRCAPSTGGSSAIFFACYMILHTFVHTMTFWCVRVFTQGYTKKKIDTLLFFESQTGEVQNTSERYSSCRYNERQLIDVTVVRRVRPRAERRYHAYHHPLTNKQIAIKPVSIHI